jgi:hypothetical protein
MTRFILVVGDSVFSINDTVLVVLQMAPARGWLPKYNDFGQENSLIWAHGFWLALYYHEFGKLPKVGGKA